MTLSFYIPRVITRPSRLSVFSLEINVRAIIVDARRFPVPGGSWKILRLRTPKAVRAEYLIPELPN